MTLNEWVQEKYRKMEAQDVDTINRHSRTYNQYFENWIEYETTSPEGKKRILRLYDGAWYTLDMSRRKKILCKLMYAAIWLLSGVLFFLAALQWTAGNNQFYVLVFEAAALIFWVLCGYYLILHLITPLKMTIGQYKGGPIALSNFAKLSCPAYLGAAVTMVIHAFTRAGDDIVRELLCSLGFLASGAVLFSLCIIEKKMPYDITPSRPEPPKGAEKIRERELTV